MDAVTFKNFVLESQTQTEETPEILYYLETISVVIALSVKDPDAIGHISGYSCSTCSNVLASYEDLKCHEKTCSLCEDSSIDNESQVHGGETTYQLYEVTFKDETEKEEKSPELENTQSIYEHVPEHEEAVELAMSVQEEDLNETETSHLITEPVSLPNEKVVQKNKWGKALPVSLKGNEFVVSKSDREPHSVKHTKATKYSCMFCCKKFAWLHTARQHEQQCPIRKTNVEIVPTPRNELYVNIKQVSSATNGNSSILSSPVEDSKDDPVTIDAQFLQSVESLPACKGGQKGKDVKLLVCPFCHKVFAHPIHLQRHMVVHTKVQPYQCKVCNRRFCWEASFKKHEKTCKDRQKVEAVRLLQISPGPVDSNVCPFCQKVFAQSAHLQRHLVVHTKAQPYLCQVCNRRFCWEASYKKHAKTCDGRLRAESQYYDRASGTYACNVCQIQFEKWPCLRKHLQEHFDNKQNSDEGEVQSKHEQRPGNSDTLPGRKKDITTKKEDGDNSVTKAKKEVKSKKVYKSHPDRVCPICNKEFESSTRMKNHQVTHTKTQPFLCKACGKSFSWQHNLLKHSRNCPRNQDNTVKVTSEYTPVSGATYDPATDTYRCVECRKHYNSLQALQVHYAQDHKPGEASAEDSVVELSTTDHVETEGRDNDSITTHRLHVVNSLAGEDARDLKPDVDGTEHEIPAKSCEICGKVYTNSVLLDHHMEQHLQQRDVQFDTSINQFKTEPDVEHDQEAGTSAGDEAAGFEDDNMTNVLPHQCQKCSKSFPSRSKLNQHMKVHSQLKRPKAGNTKKQNLKCMYCSKPFISESGLRRHEPVCELNTTQDKQAFKCSKCKQQFQSESDLQTHEGACPGKRDGNVLKYQCDMCGKVYTQLCNLKVHYRVHTGEELYTCPKCGKNYTRRCSMRKHLAFCQKEGLEAKPFRCQFCPKTFKYHPSLMDHERMHRGDIKFKCEQCGKCYINKQNLNIHRRTHTGEKPFQCNMCGKCFMVRSSLNIHLRVHEGVRSFRCEICDKTFIFKGHLLKHQRSHSDVRPYPCPVCGKKFKEACELKKHEFLHTGERPWRCQYCDLGFKTRSNLRYHEGTHIGNKKWECSVCSQKFTMRTNMLKHQKKHTVEDLQPKILINYVNSDVMLTNTDKY